MPGGVVRRTALPAGGHGPRDFAEDVLDENDAHLVSLDILDRSQDLADQPGHPTLRQLEQQRTWTDRQHAPDRWQSRMPVHPNARQTSIAREMS
jgi:hypothetical protein